MEFPRSQGLPSSIINIAFRKLVKVELFRRIFMFSFMTVNIAVGGGGISILTFIDF